MDNILVSCVEHVEDITGQVQGKIGLFCVRLNYCNNFPLTGFIPQWLNVQMLRLGPAKWDLNGFVLNHWLDGCAMLCKFTISHGTVTFHSKFLESEAYTKMVSLNQWCWYSFTITII